MSTNIEIKAVVRDWSSFVPRALDVMKTSPTVLHQRDVYFAVNRGRLKLRYLDRQTAELIYYERPDKPIRRSDYERTPVADPESLERALARSCGIRVVVEKHRLALISTGVRVHLDTVAELGRFVEIEVLVSDCMPLKAARKRSQGLASALGLNPKDLVSQSYVDLVEARINAQPIANARQAGDRSGVFRAGVSGRFHQRERLTLRHLLGRFAHFRL